MNNVQRTELNEIGEFGLIERIKNASVLRNSTSIKGIGDDAAVIDKNEKEVFLISTDTLTEGIHFDLTYVPLKHLGYKAVAVNLSDIAAMNGKPEQIVVSLACSNRFSVEAIDELYQGMLLACERYQVDLVGGDTTSSRAGLILGITVVGTADRDKVVYRSGGKPNDIVCISGDIGGAYMGLQVLEREKQSFLADPNMQPELDEKEYIVQRQLKPEPRLDVLKELVTLDIHPTSMIDISDGLASEIMHICQASGTGADLFEDKFPIDQMTYEVAREFDLDPLTVMMNGGEDYELLFTIRQEDFEKIRNNPNITPIGYLKDAAAGVNVITKAGNSFPIKAQGWKHF
ncbi:MAG TPA: thiamine-phosphate kinase [Cytophagaceae bacterium]|nr:thiamine-phosphate kinase [Cytophagaceae bacterium]